MFEFPEQPTQHKIKQNPEPIPQLKNQKKKPFTLNHSSIIDNPPKLHTPQEQTPRTWHQIHPNHKKVRTLPTPEANHRQKGITKNRERERERVTSQSMRIEEVSERKKKWKERIRVGRRAMILITLTSHQRRGLWFFFVWFVKEFYFIFLKKGRASPKVRLSLSGTGTNKQGEDE